MKNYTGNEHLISNNEPIEATMLNFWQWGFSNLFHNMMRGNFAEFVVLTALETNGINADIPDRTGLEPYDLNGPIIKSTGKPANLEIKCAAKVQLWDIKHPDRLTFSIAPAMIPDNTGDYREGSPRQRNNDIYVFCVYNATTKEENILDMSLWSFYVVPTYLIEADAKLKKQKTISLKSVEKLVNACTFEELSVVMTNVCEKIPATYDKYVVHSKEV